MDIVSVVWNAGTILRKDATATQTFYLGEYSRLSASCPWRKCIAGSFTLLAATRDSAGLPPFLFVARADGSTLTITRDGVVMTQVTDTSIAAGGYTGIGGYLGDSVVDNFETRDLLHVNIPLENDTLTLHPSRDTAYTTRVLNATNTNNRLYGEEI